MLSNVCMFILKCQLVCAVFFYSVFVVLLPSFHCDTDSISVLKSAYEEGEQKAVNKTTTEKSEKRFSHFRNSHDRARAWLSCVKCGKIIDYAQLCFKCKWNKLKIRARISPTEAHRLKADKFQGKMKKVSCFSLSLR